VIVYLIFITILVYWITIHPVAFLQFFSYRRVDGKLLSTKNVPFFYHSLTLHRSSWTVADMSINSSKVI